MGDVIGVAALVGVPLVIFIWLQWRREEQDRRRQREGASRGDRDAGSRDSYWGGMGRPGR